MQVVGSDKSSRPLVFETPPRDNMMWRKDGQICALFLVWNLLFRFILKVIWVGSWNCWPYPSLSTFDPSFLAEDFTWIDLSWIWFLLHDNGDSIYTWYKLEWMVVWSVNAWERVHMGGKRAFLWWHIPIVYSSSLVACIISQLIPTEAFDQVQPYVIDLPLLQSSEAQCNLFLHRFMIVCHKPACCSSTL
jgi:hypothetical protein